MSSVFINQLTKVPFSAELIKFEFVYAANKLKYGFIIRWFIAKTCVRIVFRDVLV